MAKPRGRGFGVVLDYVLLVALVKDGFERKFVLNFSC